MRGLVGWGGGIFFFVPRNKKQQPLFFSPHPPPGPLARFPPPASPQCVLKRNFEPLVSRFAARRNGASAEQRLRGHHRRGAGRLAVD